MSDYPTPSEYQEAVQFPDTAFTDDELAEAEPKTNVLGLPQPITGAFAAVFPLSVRSGVQYAAKCFLSDVPDQRARYAAVADALADRDLDATVDFDYQQRGIRVDGTAYPLLKMEWVQGQTLNRFVESHLDDPAVLGRLADAWADLAAELEEAGIAHGDLQHGNVLVQTPSEDTLHLRLVDYDTVYVPALDGRASAEVGHRNYQHPDRTDADFGPHLDRFPALAVYTALRACMTHPHLWDEYDTGENLLFRDADFYDPGTSPLFQVLTNAEELRPLAEALRRACYVEPQDVPRLSAVRSGEAPSRVSAGEAQRARQRRENGRRPAERRGVVEQAFLPACLGALALAMGLGAAGGTAVALGVIAVLLVGAGGTVAAQYRRRPIVRRRRRLSQELARFDRLLHNLKRQVESLQRKRQEVMASMDERRAERLREVQEEALHDHLKHHFVGEAREVDGVRHKHVVRLKAANIRTASEATPERIADVRRLPSDVKARLRMWRSALVQQYQDEIPDTLSPAEERRLQRYVQQRIEDIDAQIARATEKIAVQTSERERIRERKEDMPVLTPARYAGYLLRLNPLPGRTEGPPTPSSPSANGSSANGASATEAASSASTARSAAEAPTSRKASAADQSSVPDLFDAADDRPWWRASAE